MTTPPHLGGHCGVTHIDEGTLQFLIERFGARSFLDIGCGPGGMVSLARAKGLFALGIDGDPSVRAPGIMIHDFTQGHESLVDEPFDLGWCVEFVEHVEDTFAENYLRTLEKCSTLLLTAAPPGTPGHHHVNCREAAYWVAVLGTRGFLLDEQTTTLVRAASTMHREFVRRHGLVFRRRDAGDPRGC
jgi:SAM-dependent methyltransferase